MERTKTDPVPGAPEPTGRFSVDSIPLHGGRPCLDFTYSVVWRDLPRPHETLVDYPSLIALSRRLGTVETDEAEALLAAARARPAEAAAVLARAIAWREAVYRVFAATSAQRAPAPTDLDLANAELAEAMAHAAVRPRGDGFAWDWAGRAGGAVPDLARPLWPLARSAAELLTSPDLPRVKRCPGDGCGWLFLDTSKNGSRRWCDMAGCGNRARVRRHYQRRRAAAV